MTSEPGHPPTEPRRVLFDDPDAIEVLRRVAVQEQTAALLELRARHASSTAQSAVLVRRARDRRESAARTLAELNRSRAMRRHPSGQED